MTVWNSPPKALHSFSIPASILHVRTGKNSKNTQGLSCRVTVSAVGEKCTKRGYERQSSRKAGFGCACTGSQSEPGRANPRLNELRERTLPGGERIGRGGIESRGEVSKPGRCGSVQPPSAFTILPFGAAAENPPLRRLKRAGFPAGRSLSALGATEPLPRTLRRFQLVPSSRVSLRACLCVRGPASGWSETRSATFVSFRRVDERNFGSFRRIDNKHLSVWSLFHEIGARWTSQHLRNGENNHPDYLFGSSRVREHFTGLYKAL
ncbi:hypothetical protein AOLI_G00013620 [Acnodon oligacanthus]